MASSADLAGDATVGLASPAVAEVASSADLAGVAPSADLDEVASSAIAEVAFSADIAGVASSADLAEVASSADLAEVASSADLAGFVTSGGTFRMECGDSVPGDCDYVCDYFADVVSLVEHAGGVPVGTAPPADTDSIVTAIMSYVKQCQNGGGSPKSPECRTVTVR